MKLKYIKTVSNLRPILMADVIFTKYVSHNLRDNNSLFLSRARNNLRDGESIVLYINFYPTSFLFNYFYLRKKE